MDSFVIGALSSSLISYVCHITVLIDEKDSVGDMGDFLRKER